MKQENAATGAGAGEAVRSNDATLDKNHPEDPPLVAGVPDDIMDKLGLVAGDDEKAVCAAQRGHKQAAYIVRVARGTRAELQELILKDVVPALLRLALVEKDSAAKQWAGMMLACIESIRNYDKKLCEINVGYRDEKKKIRSNKQLAQVIVSPKPIMQTVRQELRKAEDCCSTLCGLKGSFGETWRQPEILEGLEDYLPFMELPDFPKCLGKWWQELWPLIKKNNPGLLEKLRGGKFPTRGIRYHARWASYRNEFRNALHTLARLRTSGVR